MSTPADNLAPRILVIDDNTAIHDDFRKILGGQSAPVTSLKQAEADIFGEPVAGAKRERFRIDCAGQGREALELVEKSLQANDPYALAFVDIRMPPGWDGVETVENLWRVHPDLQAVICTAFSDYSWDDIISRCGHKDNLLILKKPFETVEVLQLAHALTKKWMLGKQARLRLGDLEQMVEERTRKLQLEIEERTRVQGALRVSEQQFSTAFHSNPMPMAIQSWPSGSFLAANPSFFELTGYTTDQLLHHSSQDLNLWGGETTLAMVSSEGRIRNQACLLRRSDGSTRHIVLWTEPMFSDARPCLMVVANDVTDQLKLEAELRQSQKLEIVGRLVANVAHEFNNILTVIQGHATLLQANMGDPEASNESIDRIFQASQRAATFTGQLLAFSRKQAPSFKKGNLSHLIRSVHSMLTASLGEHYQLHMDLADNLPNGRYSDGCAEQILINLALNARDAMPNGGVISVRTSYEVLSDADVRRNPRARAGQFVCLTVSDTGCGIPPEMIHRIFDPFFTTKEMGKGTGLGLSTVQGIVEQHYGWIAVTSEIHRGTTFRIFLPVEAQAAIAVPAAETPAPADSTVQRGEGEVVLLVEDEPTVREMTRATLEDGGYRVIEAGDGREALNIWDRSSANIDLVVTDMVMPNGVSGGALARTLQAHTPDLHVICTSGYTPEYIDRDLPSNNRITFLAKPYLPSRLLEVVRHCLVDHPVAPENIPLTPTPAMA